MHVVSCFENGGGWGMQISTCLKLEVRMDSFWGDKNVLKLDWGNVCITVKLLNSTHKMVNV